MARRVCEAVACSTWRWPWVGALGLAAFAAWWLPVFAGRGFLPSVFLLMAVLRLTVSALFLLRWTLGVRGSQIAHHGPRTLTRR